MICRALPVGNFIRTAKGVKEVFLIAINNLKIFWQASKNDKLAKRFFCVLEKSEKNAYLLILFCNYTHFLNYEKG